ncbi:MAG: aldolase/citrate lyase family protein [Vicinamibacterales bacterium]
MHSRVAVAGLGFGVLGSVVLGQSQARLNPLVELLAQKKPVFGLYAPANRPVRPPQPVKTPSDLAKEALAYEPGDILFSGSMEGNFERGYGPFAEFVAELAKSPARLKHPLVTKIPRIGTDPVKAVDNISRQLNLGVGTVVFVDVESADEVRLGLAAMRFKARGGTRPDGVGGAPAYWGVSEQEYREKADLWPLNSSGDLVNWTIVESKQGLSRIREIAAVKGIGALFPGAGTLRGVFTTVNQEGQRIFDQEGWEGAIQQVLAACKEFNVACGYPATESDIEMRMKQGFSVFIINWGDPGFRAVEIGRRVSGR